MIDKFIIDDMEWVGRNFSVLVAGCNGIIFDNVENFDIKNDIWITHDITISSKTETFLKFTDGKQIIIE